MISRPLFILHRFARGDSPPGGDLLPPSSAFCRRASASSASFLAFARSRASSNRASSVSVAARSACAAARSCSDQVDASVSGAAPLLPPPGGPLAEASEHQQFVDAGRRRVAEGGQLRGLDSRRRTGM